MNCETRRGSELRTGDTFRMTAFDDLEESDLVTVVSRKGEALRVVDEWGCTFTMMIRDHFFYEVL